MDGIEIVRVLHASRDLGAVNKSSWLVQQAIARYVNPEEKREGFIEDARQSWAHYQETERYVNGDESLAWLDSWGTAEKKPTPECRSAR